MRFLVTGGTGFVGIHVVERLLSLGHDVLCTVRDPSALRHLTAVRTPIVTYEELGDRVRSGLPIDYVIHVAGATRAIHYDSYRAANVLLTQRLLELFSAPEQRGALKRFALVSSQAAAGPCRDDGCVVTEADPPRPISNYGRSKLEAEETTLSYADRIPVTVVRPPTVFGPRDVDVLGVFRAARFGLAPCIAGPDRAVSVVCVEDLVDALLKAAFHDRAIGGIYFAANREAVIWREFCLLVGEAMGKRSRTCPIPLGALSLAARFGDVRGRLTGSPALFRSEKLEEMKQLAWVCSAEKARVELGWEAETPLFDALRKTAEWYRDAGWL